MTAGVQLLIHAVAGEILSPRPWLMGAISFATITIYY
jgi:hypothetical protein